jgi:glycosyltransferase involved in cell wall biosynthesis
LRILVVHNRYTALLPSGENAVVDAESALLVEHGHEVERFEVHTDGLRSTARTLVAVAGIPYNPRAAAAVRRRVREHRPDVVHVHNTFPLLSPAVLRAAAAEGAAVVMTLHNFRPFCAQGSFYRGGGECHACVGRPPWPALRYGCYRGSRALTLPLVAMQVGHRAAGTWTECVQRFIAPSRFVRDQVVACGLSAERVAVKVHFFPDPPPDAPRPHEGHALALGRLEEAKGTRVLLDAWREIDGAPLELAGDGPLRDWVLRHPVTTAGRARWLGARSLPECLERIRAARFVVAPSLCQETFGLVVRDAFACGRPVLAARSGALGELVEDGVTGLLVEPGDTGALVRAVRWALEHEPEMEHMGRRARAVFEERFLPGPNHDALVGIYREALAAAARG